MYAAVNWKHLCYNAQHSNNLLCCDSTRSYHNFSLSAGCSSCLPEITTLSQGDVTELCYMSAEFQSFRDVNSFKVEERPDFDIIYLIRYRFNSGHYNSSYDTLRL